VVVVGHPWPSSVRDSVARTNLDNNRMFSELRRVGRPKIGSNALESYKETAVQPLRALISAAIKWRVGLRELARRAKRDERALVATLEVKEPRFDSVRGICRALATTQDFQADGLVRALYELFEDGQHLKKRDVFEARNLIAYEISSRSYVFRDADSTIRCVNDVLDRLDNKCLHRTLASFVLARDGLIDADADIALGPGLAKLAVALSEVGFRLQERLVGDSIQAVTDHRRKALSWLRLFVATIEPTRDDKTRLWDLVKRHFGEVLLPEKIRKDWTDKAASIIASGELPAHLRDDWAHEAASIAASGAYRRRLQWERSRLAGRIRAQSLQYHGGTS